MRDNKKMAQRRCFFILHSNLKGVDGQMAIQIETLYHRVLSLHTLDPFPLPLLAAEFRLHMEADPDNFQLV